MGDYIPQPFWAVILAALGCVLAIAVLFHPGDASVSTSVLAISNSLVAGALGAFAGHKFAQSKPSPPPQE